MARLWLLETEQGKMINLYPFYALDQDVDTTVRNILAAHPKETFRKVRRMEHGFRIHLRYFPPTLPEEVSFIRIKALFLKKCATLPSVFSGWAFSHNVARRRFLVLSHL